jgi:RNA polymerase sigma-70 factor (ECF subfamily)
MTWLHRVTVNAALLHRRKAAQRRERQGSVSTVPARADSDEPERRALDREARARIERAIAQLPPRYRNVHFLADVEGLANAEVGARLGLRLGAVKSRLHRARLLLRRALAPYFQTLPG